MLCSAHRKHHERDALYWHTNCTRSTHSMWRLDKVCSCCLLCYVYRKEYHADFHLEDEHGQAPSRVLKTATLPKDFSQTYNAHVKKHGSRINLGRPQALITLEDIAHLSLLYPALKWDKMVRRTNASCTCVGRA